MNEYFGQLKRSILARLITCQLGLLCVILVSSNFWSFTH